MNYYEVISYLNNLRQNETRKKDKKKKETEMARRTFIFQNVSFQWIFIGLQRISII